MLNSGEALLIWVKERFFRWFGVEKTVSNASGNEDTTDQEKDSQPSTSSAAEPKGSTGPSLGLFGYLPAGTRFMYRNGTVEQIPDTDNSGPKFQHDRDERYDAILDILREMTIEETKQHLGQEHCKECVACEEADTDGPDNDVCIPQKTDTCFGAYMAAVQAFDNAPNSLCQEILKND